MGRSSAIESDQTMQREATPIPAAELWTATRNGPEIDPRKLAAAVASAVEGGELDFRSRLLVRDSLNALKRYWGQERFGAWLAAVSDRALIERILSFDFGEVGFPSLEARLMEPTDRSTVMDFLRELSLHVRKPTRMNVGGSIALILTDQLQRATEDIVVDEVPAELRSQHLEDMAKRYGLRLAHFQSHYLPEGWQSRVRSLEAMGHLHVFLVDGYDVFLSKLFSARTKDRDDLRVLRGGLDKNLLVSRLLATTLSLRSDSKLRSHAEQNWFILFGETLPS